VTGIHDGIPAVVQGLGKLSSRFPASLKKSSDSADFAE